MAQKAQLRRTIQYWRLVDSRDDAEVDEYDWDTLFRPDINVRTAYDIDGAPVAGTVRSYDLPSLEDVATQLPSDLVKPFDPELYPTGVVLSTAKDFIPNQEQQESGDQRPMERAGDDWEPVDNLFVIHLPIGNIVAVLAESVSSSRAGKYAEWLNKYMISKGVIDPNDPDFRWGATPVTDDEAKKKLKESNELKAFVVAGKVGENVAKQLPAVLKIFNGPARQPTGIRIEMKVTIDRQSGGGDDPEIIHDWFEDTFGSLDGATKAQVSAYVGDQKTPTEIDLIKQRLTRKRSVDMEDQVTRVISVRNAFAAIWEAFVLDLDDLKRLRFLTTP